MNKSRRINELARDLEVKSGAILDKLKELGINGKTHSSSVDEDVVLQLRHVFLGEDLPAGATLGSAKASNGASHESASERRAEASHIRIPKPTSKKGSGDPTGLPLTHRIANP